MHNSSHTILNQPENILFETEEPDSIIKVPGLVMVFMSKYLWVFFVMVFNLAHGLWLGTIFES